MNTESSKGAQYKISLSSKVGVRELYNMDNRCSSGAHYTGSSSNHEWEGHAMILHYTLTMLSSKLMGQKLTWVLLSKILEAICTCN